MTQKWPSKRVSGHGNGFRHLSRLASSYHCDLFWPMINTLNPLFLFLPSPPLFPRTSAIFQLKRPIMRRNWRFLIGRSWAVETRPTRSAPNQSGCWSMTAISQQQPPPQQQQQSSNNNSVINGATAPSGGRFWRQFPANKAGNPSPSPPLPIKAEANHQRKIPMLLTSWALSRDLCTSSRSGWSALVSQSKSWK